jgi:hypothetical protein
VRPQVGAWRRLQALDSKHSPGEALGAQWAERD